MDLQSIKQELVFLLADQSASFGLSGIISFLFALFLCAMLAWMLSWVYVKYGNSLSNRKEFAKNFIVLATTTMFIITVVKSSLALSLGLVGALSIVRFRAAIKEPEELTYLFLNIAIGLGCGANQVIFTLLSFVSIVSFIIIGKYLSVRSKGNVSASRSSYLLIVCENKTVELNQIIDVLSTKCNTLKLKRTDEAGGRFEASFYIDFNEWTHFEEIRKDLTKMDENMKITFMDTSKDY